MKVRIHYRDGSTALGLITRIVGRTLFALVPGIGRVVSFRFNLGDWISDHGHLISHEFGDQPRMTRVSLRRLASPAN